MLGYGITNAQCTGDNQVLLGNTAVSVISGQVPFTIYSDKRFKTNIQEDVKGLDFIMKLKPVTYNENPEILHNIWGTPDSILKKLDFTDIKKMRFIGLLAQDVEIAAKESGWNNFPGIDVPKNKNEVYSLRYTDFIMPVIKSIQEQQEQINVQQQTILKQQEQINLQEQTNLKQQEQLILQQQNINELKTMVLEMQQKLNKLENK